MELGLVKKLTSGRLKARLIGVALLSLVACKKPATWSTEARSPDGAWIATAQTVVYSGFGTGTVETTVELRRSNGSGSPERVLAFADDGPALHLTMRWENPSHLVVRYKANPVLLYYQVVKTSGVYISVENTSPNPDQEYRPPVRP